MGFLYQSDGLQLLCYAAKTKVRDMTFVGHNIAILLEYFSVLFQFSIEFHSGFIHCERCIEKFRLIIQNI